MKPYKISAHIHSLTGEMKEAAILEKVGDNDYIAEYRGVKCHAIFTVQLYLLLGRHLYNRQGGKGQ